MTSTAPHNPVGDEPLTLVPRPPTTALSGFQLVCAFLGGCALLFIVAPLLHMALRCPISDLLRTAGEEEVRQSILLTLGASLGATLIFAIPAIPLAYLLARAEFRGKALVRALIDLPVVVPHSAAGIAILGIVSRNTIIGRAGDAVGIPFVGGVAGIMTAMAFVSLPFLINAARTGFEAVPERYEKAALNLGASPARVFRTISLPLAWRSILTGLVMMWARGLSEFGAVVIVAYRPMITPVLIYERFGAFGLKFARPVAVLFLAICLLVFLLMKYLEWRQSER